MLGRASKVSSATQSEGVWPGPAYHDRATDLWGSPPSELPELRDIKAASDFRSSQAPPMPALDVPDNTNGAQIPGLVSSLSVTNPRPARFMLTNHGASGGYFEPSMDEELMRHIPVGYSSLYCQEQVAIVLDGRLVRMWAPSPVSDEGYLLVLPQTPSQPFLTVSPPRLLRSAMNQTCNLSARMPGIPHLLSRTLWKRDWH